MALKRSCISRAIISLAPTAPNAPIFLSYVFLLQAIIDKYLKVKDYKVVHDREFGCQNLEGYKELVAILEERRLEYTGLEFFC